jgi:hypothetical protein
MKQDFLKRFSPENSVGDRENRPIRAYKLNLDQNYFCKSIKAANFIKKSELENLFKYKCRFI